MKSFFHTLKVEHVHQKQRATRDEARRDLFADIEGYDDRQRIRAPLGFITPEQADRNASRPPVRKVGGRIDAPGSPRLALARTERNRTVDPSQIRRFPPSGSDEPRGGRDSGLSRGSPGDSSR